MPRSAPGETRTHTEQILSLLPLPIGLLGLTVRVGEDSWFPLNTPTILGHFVFRALTPQYFSGILQATTL